MRMAGGTCGQFIHNVQLKNALACRQGVELFDNFGATLREILKEGDSRMICKFTEISAVVQWRARFLHKGGALCATLHLTTSF